MKPYTREFSTFLLVTMLAGGLQAASDSKRNENRSSRASSQSRQSANETAP
jgi:hypothetical protein